MSSWVAVAAANNAEWCDIVCRTHNIVADRSAGAWTTQTRSPPLYPDAVTLAPGAETTTVLARIDRSPGCSVKDSFATLDLTEHGFRVLFDAQWYVHEPVARQTAVPGPRWTVVRDLATFGRWESAWRGADGPADVLHPSLLNETTVTVLAAEKGERIVGGAILNRSSDVVGITNFFAEQGTAPDTWEGCFVFASSLFPGAAFVGYESGRDLEVVRSLGAMVVGPLRVWINEPLRWCVLDRPPGVLGCL